MPKPWEERTPNEIAGALSSAMLGLLQVASRGSQVYGANAAKLAGRGLLEKSARRKSPLRARRGRIAYRATERGLMVVAAATKRMTDRNRLAREVAREYLRKHGAEVHCDAVPQCVDQNGVPEDDCDSRSHVLAFLATVVSEWR